MTDVTPVCVCILHIVTGVILIGVVMINNCLGLARGVRFLKWFVGNLRYSNVV